MSFRFPILILLCWGFAQVAWSARVAVMLIDSKMDDKAAVAVALAKRDAQNPARPQYDEVILVMTGAENRNKIGEGMRQYLTRAENHEPALSTDWRTRIRWFQTRGNVMGKEVSHERWYKDLIPQMQLPVATGQALAASIARPATVDMFQLAPCEDSDVWDFINAIPNINIYHLFYGYNSRQGSHTPRMSDAASKALAQRQSMFHATLQKRLRAKHAQARLIFTQNQPTFNSPGAGSQDLEWCRRYFPQEDVNMSLSDAFWTSLIREANPYADKALQLKAIPQNEDSFLTQVVSARLQNNPLRQQIHDMLESAAKSNKFQADNARSHYRVTNILVEEFSSTPAPTLELGDANHITAVFDYLDEEKSGRKGACKLVPAVCDMSGTNPKQPPNVDSGTSPTGQGWLLKNCDIRKTRNSIERILGTGRKAK